MLRSSPLALALSAALLLSASVAVFAQDVHVRVDAHGPGSTASSTDFITIQQALDHAPDAPHGRIFVHIAPGIYKERINVTRLRPRLTLLGEGKLPEDTVISAAQFAKQAGGTYFTETAQINADDFQADNLTFENTAGPVGQAVAAVVRSDRAIFKHCRFLGDQDTLFADFGRQYFVDSYVTGGVDFIFGNATAVFDHSEIHILRPGFLTAQSRTSPTQTTGYVITHSRVTSSISTPPPADPTKEVRSTFFLGRPWRPFSRVVVMNTELPADLSPPGWSAWQRSDPGPKAFYAEFNNTGPGNRPDARVGWSHQLTAGEAAAYEPRTFLRGSDSWDPVAEAAKLPDPPATLTAAEDHARLLKALGSASLRPGVSPKADSANPVNYDESKANPWPSLPDPLTLSSGRRITTSAAWYKLRRPQLLDLFSDNLFGRVPANAPAVTWRVASTDHTPVGDTAVTTKHLIGHADNSAYPLLDVNMEVDLTTPAGTTGPVPVIVEVTFEKYPRAPSAKPTPAPPPPVAHPTWKEQVLARGWGYALFYPTTFQADNGAGLTSGIIGLVNHGQPRGINDWGALRAWAWGTSRLLDYLATDPSVDARRVAIEGHSRFGKTAIVAMAYDPRFAAAYVSSSGAGGASLARHRFGEQLENIAAPGEYHWMGANYLRYAGSLTPADLPVDTHELIALCAPRPVFIGGGVTEGDGWADTRGAFLAEVAAGPVYRLLGAHDLGTTTFPPVDTALTTGDLAFRQQNGGHTPLPNFPFFLDFAARYLQQSSASPVAAVSR